MPNLSHVFEKDWTFIFDYMSTGSACPRSPAERTVLFIAAGSFHGSTPLLELLMSSRGKLATLCRANTWQCEGWWILQRMGPLHTPGDTLHQGRRLDDRFDAYWEAALQRPRYDKMLGAFAAFWDLRRPVLVEKTPFQYVWLQEQHDELPDIQSDSRAY